MKARLLIIVLLTAATAGLTFALSAVSKAPGKPLHADKVLVEKAQRRLTLLWHGAAVKAYRVALGRAPVGRKQCEGDDRTPEGIYRIDSRNAASVYHRALHISYPNAADVAAARRRGCAPGGAIMIHGIRNGFGAIGSLHTARDWTKGCIAVTNAEIKEIWSAVPNGATVEIRP
jgi:murein L,D-transpeptidase YafK